MTFALALGLALAATPGCVQVEIATSGRSAHGSAIMPAAAPHLLIKALEGLPDWVDGSNAVAAARITSLKAAPAINVIPRRASAILDMAVYDETVDPELWLANLSQTLGSQVEIELLTTPCRPQS